MPTVTPCQSPADFASTVALTLGYPAWLDLDLSFRDLETGFAGFHAMHGLAAGVCEMKRLDVYAGFQGMGRGLYAEMKLGIKSCKPTNSGEIHTHGSTITHRMSRRGLSCRVPWQCPQCNLRR